MVKRVTTGLPPRMHRKARSHFLARSSISKFQLRLKTSSPTEWPPHLLAAWNILKNELRLADSQARSIVLDAVSAAHESVIAQTQELHHSEVLRARVTIENACRRVVNCIRRAPARVRRQLDEAITPLMREPVLDLEVMDAIFTAAVRVIRKCPDVKLARTVLGALAQIKRAHYEALDMESRAGVENALAGLARKSGADHSVRAVDVFAAAAAALNGAEQPAASKHVQVLIIRYVLRVAEIWLGAGLKPSRAVSSSSKAYRSKFHRFAELTVVGTAAPWSLEHKRRHSSEKSQSWKAMRRPEYQWIVSDDHVRRALRQFQISRLPTP
jgi:hypothetical protein